MGFFSSLFGSWGSSKSKSVYGGNAKRTFAPIQNRNDPNSNKSTENTSRFKRFRSSSA